MQLLQVYEVS